MLVRQWAVFIHSTDNMFITASPTLIARLVEESLAAVVIIDEEGRIAYINAAMQTLSGYAAGEVVGQALTGMLPDGVVAQHQEYVSTYISSGKPSTVLGQVRAFAIKHRTGDMIPVEMKALDLGVADGKRYFGAFMEDLRPRRQMEADHAALLARLEHEALCDPLTGLGNRRAFGNEATLTVARAQRSQNDVTVAVADIDHFKKINDLHGHAVGDSVLAAISAVIRDAARASDFVARIGGEEFGLLLPAATPEKARRVAERIREAVMACQVTTPEGVQVKVTISIGLAQLTNGMELDDALALADGALYEAKNGGRNCVRLAR